MPGGEYARQSPVSNLVRVRYSNGWGTTPEERYIERFVIEGAKDNHKGVGRAAEVHG